MQRQLLQGECVLGQGLMPGAPAGQKVDQAGAGAVLQHCCPYCWALCESNCQSEGSEDPVSVLHLFLQLDKQALSAHRSSLCSESMQVCIKDSRGVGGDRAGCVIHMGLLMVGCHCTARAPLLLVAMAIEMGPPHKFHRETVGNADALACHIMAPLILIVIVHTAARNCKYAEQC